MKKTKVKYTDYEKLLNKYEKSKLASKRKDLMIIVLKDLLAKSILDVKKLEDKLEETSTSSGKELTVFAYMLSEITGQSISRNKVYSWLRDTGYVYKHKGKNYVNESRSTFCDIEILLNHRYPSTNSKVHVTNFGLKKLIPEFISSEYPEKLKEAYTYISNIK